MILYIIGLILCYTYNLPVSVTVLCWIGIVLKFLCGVFEMIRGFMKISQGDN